MSNVNLEGRQKVLAEWKDVLDVEGLPPIKNRDIRYAVAQMMENTERAQKNGEMATTAMLHEDGFGTGGTLTEAAPTNATGTNVDNYDPVLISLIRRAMPNLIAYDLVGVQPMSGPSGLVFAMRSRYASQTGTEAFYNEANTAFSAHDATPAAMANTIGQKHEGGTSFDGDPDNANLASNGAYNYSAGMTTATAEALGGASTEEFAEMAFSIEKVTVQAKSRALKAEYSMELAQDLKAIHSLDAETELSNILSTEILAEINREIIRTINVTAVPGSQQTGSVTTAGFFDLDTDSNGRWSVEKFKGLLFQIERESNQIAKSTRRGKGNVMICSSDVASALQAADVLDYTPALNSKALEVDDTGNTFAGVLNGRHRVYIDPYTTGNYMTVGYKGSHSWDAGMYYCPYVPLQMVRAVGENSFQPRIGFKTRYGIVANPFAKGTGALTDAEQKILPEDTNVYYRRTVVKNLM